MLSLKIIGETFFKFPVPIPSNVIGFFGIDAYIVPEKIVSVYPYLSMKCTEKNSKIGFDVRDAYILYS